MDNFTQYQFRAKLWKYPGKGGWFFVSLPKLLSAKIRKKHGICEEGWGRLKAQANIGKTIWDSPIWFDSKKNTYLLAVKASIRKSELLEKDSLIRVKLKIAHIDSKVAKILRV